MDFKTFSENVKTNLGLHIDISNTPVYKMLVWTGSNLEFFDVESDETVIGFTNPSVKLAQEIYKKSAAKESQIIIPTIGVKIMSRIPENNQ